MRRPRTGVGLQTSASKFCTLTSCSWATAVPPGAACAPLRPSEDCSLQDSCGGVNPYEAGYTAAVALPQLYATLFAVDTIVKILLVQVIVALGGVS